MIKSIVYEQKMVQLFLKCVLFTSCVLIGSKHRASQKCTIAPIIIIIISIIRVQKQRFPSNSLYPRCALISNLVQLNVLKCVFNLKYFNYNCFRLLT